jgi:hypothetical protein
VTQGADVVRDDPPERPLRELLAELWENSEKLVRQEFQLALSELDQRLDKAKTALVGAAIGGAILYAGMLACVAAAILLQAEVMVPWLAALIVGAVAVGGGVAMLQKAKKDVKPEKPTLERTAQSVRRDVRTFEEAVK